MKIPVSLRGDGYFNWKSEKFLKKIKTAVEK